MALLSDETLMAYADGELDAVAQARVEAILARDPQSQSRLEVFVATGAPLKALYDKPMEEPIPPHLVALVLGGKGGERASAGRKTVRAGQRSMGLLATLNALFASPQWSMVAVLSGVILVTGAFGGWYLHGITGTQTGSMDGLVNLDRGQIFAQGAFKRSLETAPSGQMVTLETGKTGFTMRAALTFKNRLQAYCRQYDVKTPDSQYAGIACRDGDGQWRLEIHMAATPHSISRDHTTPAAGKGSSDVEAAVNSVIEGDALGHDDEETLIRNSWRP